MKIVIKSGILEAEIVGGSLSIEDIKGLLKNLSQEEIEEITTTEGIKTAGTAKVSPYSSKSNMQDKLNAKPRMPI